MSITKEIKRNLSVEQSGVRLIMPYIKQISIGGRYIVLPSIGESKFNKDTSRELQKYGDIFVQLPNKQIETIELKTEVENKHNNLFLVLWADKKRERSGWMYTCKADVLLYTFLKTKEIYRANFPSLKIWFEENKESYPEKITMKGGNVIVAKVVPIQELLELRFLQKIKI
jgi:hypothetical protein